MCLSIPSGIRRRDAIGSPEAADEDRRGPAHRMASPSRPHGSWPRNRRERSASASSARAWSRRAGAAIRPRPSESLRGSALGRWSRSGLSAVVARTRPCDGVTVAAAETGLDPALREVLARRCHGAHAGDGDADLEPVAKIGLQDQLARADHSSIEITEAIDGVLRRPFTGPPRDRTRRLRQNDQRNVSSRASPTFKLRGRRRRTAGAGGLVIGATGPRPRT